MTEDATIRRLEAENDALRLRSARHEFRQMEQELTAPDPFRLDLVVEGDHRRSDLGLQLASEVMPTPLPVPAGSIQPEALPADMPVIAVYDDGLAGRQLAAALLGLLKTQYRAPFARLVFLCSSFEAVPFLGRYGLAVEHIGRTEPASALARLHRRYRVSQIRSVGTGALIAERD